MTVKVTQLSKDLNLKPKDVTDILAASGIAVKSGSSLTTEQTDIFLEKITRAHQIVNIDDYIDGITVIPSSRKPATAEKKPAESEKAPETAGNGQKETQSGPAESASKPNVPVKEKEKQPVARTAGERFESRLNASTAKTKDGQPKKPDQKPQPQKHGIEVRERKGDAEGDVVRVTVPKSNTRVVDTRGTDAVDLSKYDEKLDTFVAEDGRKDMDAGRNKVAKKVVTAENNQSGDSRGQKNQNQGQNRGQQQKGQKQQNNAPQGNKNQKQNNQKQNQQPQNGKKPPFQKGQKGQKGQPAAPVKKQPVKAVIPDEITVGEFASRIKVTAAEVVKRLMLMGMMVTVNQTIDFDTAFLIADELGAEVTKEVVVSIEDKLFEENTKEDTDDQLVPRAPVVCVMGHVDHGKTSLLDAIRNTKVTAGEAGGITQAIGAYRVKIHGRDITFLDTPGHAAFTAMRARGAQATDIAILVVAADDGIMPQTVEAINHAKAAGVEIIVAINKMDKPTANPDQIKTELTKYDLVPDDWGGNVMCVPVSALKRTGIDELLEDILLIADLKEYKANPNRRAKGVVIESRLDKGRGPVATVLIQNGTLHTGDIVIAGTCVGRVRAMIDHTGRTLREAGPSVPVEIIGLDDVPQAGDEVNGVADERMARELADNRRAKQKEAEFKANSRANLSNLFEQIQEGVKDLNVIVKADVVGSAEAVKQSLEKLSNDEVHVHVIHAAAGGITEGDVTFADASSAIIVGFNVRPDKNATDLADRQGVEIRTYRVIYECIDEITAAMKGMLAPKFREAVLGHAEVRQVIHVPNVGFIAGSYVQDGKITRSAQIRVVRDGIVIYEDKIASLRRFKDDVKEVAQSFECGIGLEKFNDMREGDILEAFTMEQIEAE